MPPTLESQAQRVVSQHAIEMTDLLGPPTGVLSSGSEDESSSLVGTLVSLVEDYAGGRVSVAEPWSILSSAAVLLYGRPGVVLFPSRATMEWPGDLNDDEPLGAMLFRAGARMSYDFGLDLTGRQVAATLGIGTLEMEARIAVGSLEVCGRTDNDDVIVRSSAFEPMRRASHPSPSFRPPMYTSQPPLSARRLGIADLSLRGLTREAAQVAAMRASHCALGLTPRALVVGCMPLTVVDLEKTPLWTLISSLVDVASGAMPPSETTDNAQLRLRRLLYGSHGVAAPVEDAAYFDRPNPSDPFQVLLVGCTLRTLLRDGESVPVGVLATVLGVEHGDLTGQLGPLVGSTGLVPANAAAELLMSPRNRSAESS